jgi:hypothetical protein
VAHRLEGAPGCDLPNSRGTPRHRSRQGIRAMLSTHCNAHAESSYPETKAENSWDGRLCVPADRDVGCCVLEEPLVPAPGLGVDWVPLALFIPSLSARFHLTFLRRSGLVRAVACSTACHRVKPIEIATVAVCTPRVALEIFAETFDHADAGKADLGGLAPRARSSSVDGCGFLMGHLPPGRAALSSTLRGAPEGEGLPSKSAPASG